MQKPKIILFSSLTRFNLFGVENLIRKTHFIVNYTQITLPRDFMQIWVLDNTVLIIYKPIKTIILHNVSILSIRTEVDYLVY